MKNVYNEEALIVWQKWFDPFGEDDASVTNSSTDNDGSDYDDDTQDPLNQKPVRAIATPMGLIPYTENTASGKIFNFWVGHTNFSITKSIADTIEIIDGVETLDIFTRYRFRIGIGKIFDASKVMKEINDTVYKLLG
jgi:hypothetical protein